MKTSRLAMSCFSELEERGGGVGTWNCLLDGDTGNGVFGQMCILCALSYACEF